MRLVILPVLASLAAAPAASATPDAPGEAERARERDAAARVVERMAQRVSPGEPGAAVLVRRKGRTLLAHGRGVRDLRTREPIDARTAFRLASLTKAFTATAIGLLVRDGRLRYDQPLTDLLAFPAYGRPVTLRHLLTHTSGLPDYEALMEKAERARGPLWTAERQIRDQEVLALLRAETSGLFAPGTRFSYSNSGYVVLGLVVARVSGRPFGDVLRERVFEPLGMHHTLAYERGTNEVARRAYGHARDGGAFREADQSSTSATLGDGGVYSTLEDLARWDDALRGYRLLSPAAMKPALTPVRLADGSEPRWPPGAAGGDNLAPGAEVAYGFGWQLDPWRGRPRMWHQGETIGFHNAIHRFTEDALSVVVLSNRDDLDAIGLGLELAELFLDTRKDD
jgi:CubicO group peptidase (beta-lactamase class C family)